VIKQFLLTEEDVSCVTLLVIAYQCRAVWRSGLGLLFNDNSKHEKKPPVPVKRMDSLR